MSHWFSCGVIGSFQVSDGHKQSAYISGNPLPAQIRKLMFTFIWILYGDDWLFVEIRLLAPFLDVVTPKSSYTLNIAWLQERLVHKIHFYLKTFVSNLKDFSVTFNLKQGTIGDTYLLIFCWHLVGATWQNLFVIFTCSNIGGSFYGVFNIFVSLKINVIFLECGINWVLRGTQIVASLKDALNTFMWLIWLIFLWHWFLVMLVSLAMTWKHLQADIGCHTGSVSDLWQFDMKFNLIVVHHNN